MLALGKSKPWPEALEKLTGTKHISIKPLKEYFAVLEAWLKEQREKEKYKIGWSLSKDPLRPLGAKKPKYFA